jgi:uncharacterized protein YecE (DUF72 family)
MKPPPSAQVPRSFVGTSGFSYPDWKGVFYPDWMPSRDRFHYYATRLNAVEINATFYRSPSSSMLQRWKESAPRDFRFVLKASQAITHQRRLADCSDELKRMVAEYAPLGEQLGCVLFQLPPSLRRDDDRLERFLLIATEHLEDAAIAPRLALEFRHASWNEARTLDRLCRHGCGMVIHDMKQSGGWQLQQGRLKGGGLSASRDELFARPMPILYLRFHGTTGKYAGEYGAGGLAPWAALAGAALERKIDVHAYFNNSQVGDAACDALRFADLVHQK